MEYGNLAAEYVQAMGAYTATGTPFSVAAGRLSFTFGMKGPAVCVLPSHALSRYKQCGTSQSPSACVTQQVFQY